VIRPVAVTGAAGLVGSAVVRALAGGDGPQAVRALVHRGGTPLGLSGIAEHPVELTEPAGLEAALDGCSAVVHAAARMLGDDAEVRASIVDATRGVLAAARAASVERVVLVSTVAVYGGGDMLDVDEYRPRDPRGAYAEAKAEAEDLVRAAVAAGDLDAWILRCPSVWGPRDRYLTPLFVHLAQAGAVPVVRGKPVVIDLVMADDLARACLAAAGTPGGAGRALHVTSGEGLTLPEIAGRVGAALGRDLRLLEVDEGGPLPPGVPADLFDLVREHRSFAIGRAREELGFRPRVPFPEGLAAAAGA